MKIETNYHEKTLSACSRFIIAYEIMSRELNDLLVVDLDVYFTEESIRQLKLIIDENKISLSLKTNLQRLIPWTAVAAGASYFPNRNSSLNFLKNIVNYINYSYNPEYNWYLDQNALFYAYRVCKNLYPMEKINNIHRFTSSLLTKNDSIDLIRWKRSLVGEYGLTN